jgi:hypothetical protein
MDGTVGAQMPSWILACGNCGSEFPHSVIEDVGLLSYFLPHKPEFAPSGIELECPRCRQKATLSA